MAKFIGLTDPLYDYITSVSLRESPVLGRLRAETATMPRAQMQIAPDQGAFMQMLVRLTGARNCLEVGVFTGYSALAVALVLPDDGHLTACDISVEYTAIARRYWHEAGVDKKIDLRIGPALKTLDVLISEDRTGTYDFAFIDADKASYDGYYERALKLLRPGGLVAVDNMLWGGSVVDAAKSDPDIAAIRALNKKVGADTRVDVSLLPVGDGLLLARKRA